MSLTAGRLIGRQEACDRLEAMLVPGALVTLTGPGGVGKTRLAEELAALVEVSPDGLARADRPPV